MQPYSDKKMETSWEWGMIYGCFEPDVCDLENSLLLDGQLVCGVRIALIRDTGNNLVRVTAVW